MKDSVTMHFFHDTFFLTIAKEFCACVTYHSLSDVSWMHNRLESISFDRSAVIVSLLGSLFSFY